MPETPMESLLLKGVRVIDPASGLDAVRDAGLANGVIITIAEGIAALGGTRVKDRAGAVLRRPAFEAQGDAVPGAKIHRQVASRRARPYAPEEGRPGGMAPAKQPPANPGRFTTVFRVAAAGATIHCSSALPSVSGLRPKTQSVILAFGLRGPFADPLSPRPLWTIFHPSRPPALRRLCPDMPGLSSAARPARRFVGRSNAVARPHL
jgi:hypothetical protein